MCLASKTLETGKGIVEIETGCGCRERISTSDSTHKDDDMPVNIRRLQLFVVLSMSFVIGVTITVLTV